MSKYTRGPWKIFKGLGANKRRPVIVDSITDVDGKFVGNCICYAASTNPDAEANARLIAAAPDLLRLLKEVTTPFSGDRSSSDWLDECRDLIAKAEATR